MTKRIIGVFFKTLFISLAIFSTYYFFFLKPKIELAQNRSETIKILSLHKDTLIQNRIAYITLTQLDPDSANFNAEKVSAVNTLKTTREKGLSDIENYKVIPNVNKELYNRLPYLLDFRRESIAQLPVHHELDQLVRVDVARAFRGYPLSIPEHRHPV